MDKAIQYIWQFIMNNYTLYAFFFMLFMFIIKCLIVSFYFSLIYFGIRFIKKHLHTRMSVRVNYYSWYALIFSIVLENFGNYRSQLYDLHAVSVGNYRSQLYDLLATSGPYIYVTGCVLATAWIIIVICKLTAHILLNHKTKKSLKSMERFDDNEGLAERAALALGLRRMPDIMIACYIETPVSYGVFIKTVLLPDNYEEKYSHSELYLLLLHEMTHIKHGDTAKLYLVNLAECFLWITPAIRLFVKNFKRDSEILCDNRVIGLHGSDRDTYGALILKECVVKNTTMGFGFSDSYYTLSNRLDALYRNKPEMHRRVSITVVTMMVILIISCVSYFINSSYLSLNHNLEFEITITNADFTNVELLDSDVCDGVYYKVTDGDICIDKLALGELAGSFTDGKYDRIYISSSLYSIRYNDGILLGRGTNFLFSFDELVNIQESSRYYTQKLSKLGAMEALFLLIASKL